MKNKHWVVAVSTLLALLFSLTACSNEDKETEKKESASVESSLEKVSDTIYSYTVTNKTDKDVSYDFTSGQRFDYTISSDKEVIHQLSSVSMYTQALGEETIPAGKSLTYEFEVPAADLKPGTYTLKAWLTPSEGAKYETESEYTIK